MLNKKVEDALNAQINAEMWSAYLYLSMAAHMHDAGQSGMAKWFEVQFKEEQDHAQIFYNYIVQLSSRLSMKFQQSGIRLWPCLKTLWSTSVR